MSKAKTLSLWEYISYNNSVLSCRFKELNLLDNLPIECISSKKFLNIYMENENLDIDFLKDLYNEYFIFINKN